MEARGVEICKNHKKHLFSTVRLFFFTEKPNVDTPGLIYIQKSPKTKVKNGESAHGRQPLNNLCRRRRR